MLHGASSPSSSKPNRNAQASSSGTKKVDSHPAQPGSRQDAHSSGSALKRTKSLPAHLPSHPRQSTEIKTIRKPITRPAPDRRPPKSFHFDMGTRVGAGFKQDAMEHVLATHFIKNWLAPKIEGNSYYMECLKSMHPKIEKYTPENKVKAYENFAFAHPRLRAEIALKRNVEYAVPNSATSSRRMHPMEQKFLSSAMRHIQKDIARKPFHRHGESCVTGDENGHVVRFRHEPHASVSSTPLKGDKYTLHNHPPFGEPFMSSASEADHLVAAESYLYLNNKMTE